MDLEGFVRTTSGAVVEFLPTWYFFQAQGPRARSAWGPVQDSKRGATSTPEGPSLTYNENSGKARPNEDVFSPSKTSVA